MGFKARISILGKGKKSRKKNTGKGKKIEPKTIGKGKKTRKYIGKDAYVIQEKA